jgi:hypothetical protein
VSSRASIVAAACPACATRVGRTAVLPLTADAGSDDRRGTEAGLIDAEPVEPGTVIIRGSQGDRTVGSLSYAKLMELSPRELQVARVAARGQNNIEGHCPVRVPQDGRGTSDKGLPQAEDSLAH